MPNKIEDNNTSLYEILRTIQELPEGDSAVITAAVEETDSGAVISVTDANGTTTATLSNGKDGVTPEKGVDYFTSADKQELVDAVIASFATESWTFVLEDGSEVVKEVFVK